MASYEEVVSFHSKTSSRFPFLIQDAERTSRGRFEHVCVRMLLLYLPLLASLASTSYLTRNHAIASSPNKSCFISKPKQLYIFSVPPFWTSTPSKCSCFYGLVAGRGQKQEILLWFSSCVEESFVGRAQRFKPRLAEMRYFRKQCPYRPKMAVSAAKCQSSCSIFQHDPS
jgi:hypothetical protein